MSDVHMPILGAGHFGDFYGLFSNHGETPISWDMEPL